LLRRDSERVKADFVHRFHRLEAMFARAHARDWAAIKDDANFKSRMRLEGTAGELAARRSV
jgi:hypothetical protein